jgi:hypothetical protein
VLGGISTGQPIVARFAVKPTSSILTPRQAVTRDGRDTELLTKGRHDPCVGIRAVPVGEAMLCLRAGGSFVAAPGAESSRSCNGPVAKALIRVAGSELSRIYVDARRRGHAASRLDGWQTRPPCLIPPCTPLRTPCTPSRRWRAPRNGGRRCRDLGQMARPGSWQPGPRSSATRWS